MKKRRLKGYVLPTLYMLITLCIFTSIILLGSTVTLDDVQYDYGSNILEGNSESVLLEDTAVSSIIESPVASGINISVHFYNKDSEEELQKNSLIYYERTYLPSTGVVYASKESFEVRSVFSGTVLEILDDKFFGSCIVVEHSKNLRTYYYGLENINVEAGNTLENGALLGTSRVNEILNTQNTFLLEVYYNSELIDPEKFIGTKITDYE